MLMRQGWHNSERESGGNAKTWIIIHQNSESFVIIQR